MVVCSEFVMHDLAGFLLVENSIYESSPGPIYRLCTVHITIPDERKN